MLLLRNALATLLIPGTVVVLVPCLIVSDRPQGSSVAWGTIPVVGVLGIAWGAGILLWCVWRFAVEGQGTLAPIDPPTTLVQRGLYRYVRNPMYLGALLVLVGETLLFRSRALLTYTILWFVVVNLFVMLYEEPALRRRFGERYDAYCRRTRRWGVC